MEDKKENQEEQNFSCDLHDYGQNHYKVKFEYKYNKAATPHLTVGEKKQAEGQYIVRLTIDDKTAYIDAQDLYFLLFSISKDDAKMMMFTTQADAIAAELNFTKSLKITKEEIAQVKAGDEIKIPIRIPLKQMELAALVLDGQKNKKLVEQANTIIGKTVKIIK